MILKIGNRAFTLIEIMVGTAVLSLGIVFIYEALFISLRGFNYCADYLDLASWMEERIWLAQDVLQRFGESTELETQGKILLGNKDYDWNLSCDIIDTRAGLYNIDFTLFRQEGKKKVRLSRAAYALYE